jgi:type IV pilus assembly protein PilE
MRSGFSLLEMMVVVFIVSLLMTLSLPYYAQHVLQQNRLAAASTLLKLAAALEQYFLVNNSYAGATLATLGFSESGVHQQYQFSIRDAAADGFLIAAQPVNKQARDTSCGALTLNALGEKNISGNAEVASCW